MAGDWIKVEVTLPDKPEVIRMAEELGIDQDAVAGKLFRIWAWANQNSVDGNALPVTSSFLDRITASPGFANAMRKVAWLEGRDGSLSFPHFDRHNGQTAKSRAECNRRVAKSRAAKGTSTKGVTETCNESVTLNSLQKPLPEKRREENTSLIREVSPHIPPRGKSPGFEIPIPESLNRPEFIQAWQLWQKHRKEIKKPLTETQAKAQIAKFVSIGVARSVAAINHTVSMGWQGIREPEEANDRGKRNTSGIGSGQRFDPDSADNRGVNEF